MFLKAKKRFCRNIRVHGFLFQFLTVLQDWSIFFLFPPFVLRRIYSSVSLKTKPEYNCFELACVAGVRKGKGRELGRETTGAQIPPSPSPSPINACHSG